MAVEAAVETAQPTGTDQPQPQDAGQQQLANAPEAGTQEPEEVPSEAQASEAEAASEQPEEERPEAEAEEVTAEEGAEEEPGDKYVVTLPGLEERGEQPIELEAPDEETYNRLNRLANEAAIGRQVKEERRVLQMRQRELAEVEDMISIDPVGFVLERIPEQVRTEVAMQLLFQPTVLEAVSQRLAKNEAIRELLEGEEQVDLTSVLNNRLALHTLRAQLEADRLRMQSALREQTERRRAVQAAAERVANEIEQLIPPTIVGERRAQIFQDAVRDIRERLQRLQIDEIDPQDVRLILRDRFRRLGIELAETGNGGSPSGKAPVGAAAPAQGRTAASFKQARDLRRAAAATAPAGAGAPAARPRPDLPKGTAERIKLARKVGLRALLGLS